MHKNVISLANLMIGKLFEFDWIRKQQALIDSLKRSKSKNNIKQPAKQGGADVVICS